MKPKSDQTNNLILAIARQEFLEKGFDSTSLRTIAKKANGTTGIIYTYFKNKNEIFETLVYPVIVAFEKRFASEEISYDNATETTGISPKIWFTKNLRFLLRLVDKYPDEMRLIFLKAQGSSFHNYKELLIEKGVVRSLTIFRMLERNKAFAGQKLSEFFVLNLVTYVINVIVEVLKQNKTKKEIEMYEEEISSFLFSGWKALVEI